MKKFVWQPGNGIDSSSLERLCAHFCRPAYPMGEAWFMGENRRFFHELQGDLSVLSVCQLEDPLEEIASGISCFGPHAEWQDWYHYLLGQLLPRSHEHYGDSLLESLVTGFIALYPNGIYKASYPQFQSDILKTLGRSIMDSQCWSGNDIVIGSILHRSNNNPKRVWCWWDASGDLSASLYLCLKYLPPTLVSEWFTSVLEIRSPHWRAQVLVWLVGSRELLIGKRHWPCEFEVEDYPSVDWEWSHCLRPELTLSDESGAPAVESLIPKSSRDNVLTVAHQYFTEDMFLDWLDSISTVPYLKEELAEIPLMFKSMYVQCKKT